MSFGRCIARNQNGAVLVEVTVLIPIVIIFLFGAVDFALGFYQWNLATKAIQVGARIAAVSDPVANGLNSLSTTLVTGSASDHPPLQSQ